MSDTAVLVISPARRLLDGLIGAVTRLATRLRVQAELSAMDDRSLADLNIARADIPAIARAHAAA